MENLSIILVHDFLLILLILPLLQTPIVVAVPKHYIVYLGSHNGGLPQSGDPEAVTKSHHQLLSLVSKRNNNDSNPSKKMIYSFTKAFNAFAATLEEEEAKELASHPDVISIFESRDVTLHTTRSWDFLESFSNQGNSPVKIKESVLEKANHGEDMIIANLDSGVWPESKSFSDEEGYGPIPKKFKGQCDNELDPTFKCNRKLIGVRMFYEGIKAQVKANASFPKIVSLRDMVGHGTHTLSTAGGNFVDISNSTSVLSDLGVLNGTIKGGAPRARVVAYKVMWKELKEICDGVGSQIDILAGLEAAIVDDVDIINLSLSSILEFLENNITSADFYFEDSISIGSFHAMANGIFTVAGSGNSGPTPSHITNLAPWILTVGASTLDRQFACYVSLGNHQKIRATRFLDYPNNETYYPIVIGSNARKVSANVTSASYCLKDTLDPVKVKGKILVCLKGKTSLGLLESLVAARQVEAVGLIIANDKDAGLNMLPDSPSAVPTAHVTYNDGQLIFSYVNSTRSPTALITKTKPEVGIKPSPVIPDFSSRGPNPLNPEILKPDVIAPGVSIISAYSENPSNPNVPKVTKYLPLSGTSMATPHVAGVAALLRKIHPRWTTAAIKSSIMTTARPVDKNGKPILKQDMVTEATPFEIGAGVIQPELAMDPGLVYDMNHYDYLNFLCSFDTKGIKTFTKQHNYECPKPKSFNIMDFNYPAISIPELSGTITATRRLKNVGQPGTYTAHVQAPRGISIVVEPKTLVFSKVDQEIIFKLVFSAEPNHQLPTDYVFGSLVWSDGKHNVRSPILVKPKYSHL